MRCAVFAVWLVLPVSAIAQSEGSVCPDDEHAEFHRCALDAALTADPPRTRSGRPDFSGYWERRSWAFEDFETHPVTPDDFGDTSVVVDPPSGIVPMQPWADELRLENAQRYIHHNASCTLAGPAGTMYMAGLYQLMQDEDHFVVLGEGLSAHPYRVIPLDGRPHLGPDLPLWQGDSRGHWDGDTLVIETTSQNAKNFLDQRGRFITDEAQIVERMTMIDDNTIHYQATFDDPNVYSRPFTIALAYRRDPTPGIEVWEEACFESNSDQMTLFRNNGLRVFPGISGDEARELKRQWEARQ